MATVKALCLDCKKVTNHNVLAEHKTSGGHEEDEIRWWATYQIIQCMGCDDISFRRTSACEEDFDPYTGKLEEAESLYPDRLGGRDPMSGHESFPVKTKRIYIETIKALNNQTPILAAIGLRALIESICLEKKTKAKTLAKGIDELAQMGLLSAKQAEFLHNHRFMGNEAAHEIIAPKPEHLVAAIDIAETLLKTIYVLPEMAEQIKPKKAPTTPRTV